MSHIEEVFESRMLELRKQLAATEIARDAAMAEQCRLAAESDRRYRELVDLRSQIVIRDAEREQLRAEVKRLTALGSRTR